jgi:hypothetical protein
MTVFVNQSLTVSGTAGSLITALDTFLVGQCGWTKPFSGTNLAVYKQPAVSNGFHLRVDDSDPQYAHVRGYETMSDVDTGFNAFPSKVQFGLPIQSDAGLWITKSNVASGALRPVVFASNQKMLYAFHSTANTVWDPQTSSFENWMFGDIVSDKPGPDAYETVLIAGPSQSAPQGGCSLAASISVAGQSGHYIARAHSQLGSSQPCAKFSDYVRSISGGYFGSSGTVYPTPVTGNLNLSPVWITDTLALDTRGTLPGLWNPLHNRPLAHGDLQLGSGSLAGKTFLFVNTYQGQVAVESSDTW